MICVRGAVKRAIGWIIIKAHVEDEVGRGFEELIGHGLINRGVSFEVLDAVDGEGVLSFIRM